MALQVSGSVSSSGDNVVIAAPALPLEQIFVQGWSVYAASAVNFTFKDGAGIIFHGPIAAAILSGSARRHGSQEGSLTVIPAAHHGGIVASPGKSFIINLSGAVSVTYVIDYYIK